MNIYNTNNWKKNLCCPMAFAIAFFGMCGISQAAIPVAVNDSAGASIQGSNFTFDGGEVATDSVQGKGSQLKALLANAQSCLDSKMNADVRQALVKSMTEAENVLKSSEADSTAISSAYSDLGSKIWAAQLSIAVYKEISVFFTKAEKLDEAGYNAFNNYVADIQNAWNDGTITDGEEEISILADKLRVATKVQTTDNSDWTYAIYNPSFEDKGKHWQTKDGYKSLDVLRKDSLAWAYADGEHYAYYYNDGDTPVNVSFYQDVDSVRPGIYYVKATVYTNSKTMSIYGNDLKSEIHPCNDLNDVRTVEQMVASWDGKRIALGVIGTLQAGEEFRIDNLQLEYLSRDLDIYVQMVPDDVPMSKVARQNQESAVQAFNVEPVPANLTAAINAIADAHESARQYKKVRQYLDSVYVFLGKNNVYTKEAYTSVSNFFGSLENRYAEGTLSDDEVETMQYLMWQKELAGFNDLEASDIDAYKDYPLLYYLFDAWTLTRDDSPSEVVKADGNFRVNTWAKEVTDNTVSETSSKMTTPFIEYRNSSLNGSSLENATIHAKAINLEPGLYKMRILTRVANESGNVAPADLKGITIHVTTDRVNENNGMSVFSSETVDICKGKVYRDGNLKVVSQEFEIDSIIVRAKDNHDADVYFNIENTNVNWLAWKNCQFVKVRDLMLSEEDNPASDEEIAELWELIRRDEKKPIGFNVSEYSPYTNRDAIKTHNAARRYLESNYKEDGFNHCTKYQVNEYIKALYEDPEHPELSKWQIQNEDVNAVYNANFSLVHQSLYNELFGWKIYDTSVPQPKTGGMSASCATASSEWTKFDNAKGSINLDGVENTFSTAAMFKFPNDKTSLRYCSPQSVYTYGDSAGFEMPLDPDQTYVFSCNFGYYTEGQNGSIRIEVRNAKTNELVTDASNVYSPTKCVSDTTQIPDLIKFAFHTPKSSTMNYKNTLENFDNLETYKIVLRNANTNQAWTMVMSNLKLFKSSNSNGGDDDTPTDTVKVDISKPQTVGGESNTAAAPEVKKDEKGESVYVYKPADENKDQTITLAIPIDVIVAGTTYKVIIDLSPVFESYARPNYLTFGLKGNGSKVYDRSSADLYALGKYVYANDKEMKLEYEFTATQDMQSPVFVIKTETPVDAEDESTRSVGLKGISLVSETSSTAIETTRTETEVIPISIYNISGVNISSFQKGINVVRFSDGSVKKVFR